MSSQNNEADLVNRLKNKDDRAIIEFVNKYANSIYDAIRLVVAKEDVADDILQDSLIRCLQSIDSYVISEGSLRAWANTVGRNLAINYLRGQKAEKIVETLPANSAHLNARMKDQNGQRYEIYWTTGGAKHILENYVKDFNGGVHQGIDHTLVAKLTKTARYVIPLPDDPRPLLHVCLTGYKGKVYETYVYLVPELDQHPPRCVIVSSYVTNKQQYRQLFDK